MALVPWWECDTHEVAEYHISGLRRCWCSFIDHAWIQELNRFQMALLCSIPSRLRVRCWYQTSLTPGFSVSRRSLRKKKVAHFPQFPCNSWSSHNSSFNRWARQGKEMLSWVNVESFICLFIVSIMSLSWVRTTGSRTRMAHLFFFSPFFLYFYLRPS